jgi:hypothetical protein
LVAAEAVVTVLLVVLEELVVIGLMYLAKVLVEAHQLKRHLL